MSLPLSKWDEMYVAGTLGDVLLGASVRMDDGSLTQLVVSDVDTVARDALRRTDDWNNEAWWWLAVGLTIGSALAALGYLSHRGVVGRRIFLMLVTAWLAGTGMIGSLIVGVWILTDLPMLGGNASALLVNPAYLMCAAMLWGSDRERMWTGALVFALACLAVGVNVARYAYGGQVSGAAVLAVGLGHVGAIAGIWNLGRRATSGGTDE